MKKRSLIFGIAMTVCLAFIFSGCEQETKTEYVTNTVTDEGFRPPADTVWADSIAALEVLLADGSGVYRDNIGYDPETSAVLPALTVPSGKTLYLNSYGVSLGADLTVNGKLVVYGSTFTAGDKLKGTGTLDVEKGCRLSVSTADGLFTGDDKLTVTVKKGARLMYSGAALASATDITAWVGYAGDASLSITTAITGVSTLTAAISAIGDLPDGKGVALTINPSPASTETSLTVPAGVSITTSDTFAALTSLTVNGTLTTSSATLAAVTSLTVNGTLTAGSATTLAAVTSLTVNGTLDATAATFDSANGVTITLGNKARVTYLGKIAKLAASVTVPTGALFNISKGITAFNSNTVTFTRGNSYVISDVDIVLSGYTTAGGYELSDNITLTAGQSIILSQGKYTVKAGRTITNAGTIILGASASLVLTGADATGGAALTGAGKIVAGNTAISGAWQAVGTGNVTIAAGASTAPATSTITASANTVVFTAGEGGTITQNAGASNNLTIAANTTVALGAGSSVVLTGATGTAGAKLTSTGKVAAGKTEITGVWQAVDTGSDSATVTIAATSADASTITASAATVSLKAGTGGTITQAAGSGNKLTIAADTTVALGGAAAKLGEIVLKNSSTANATDNGKLTLVGTITTGNMAGTNQASGAVLSADGETEVSNATTYTKIGVANLAGDGTNTKVVATNNPESDGKTSNAGKIAKLIGAASGATITGGDGTATFDGTKDGKISGETATAADSTS
jgi:hypothetical protein